MTNQQKAGHLMPSGAYIITGGLCVVIALISFTNGDTPTAILFAVGVGINRMLYKRRVELETVERKRQAG